MPPVCQGHLCLLGSAGCPNPMAGWWIRFIHEKNTDDLLIFAYFCPPALVHSRCFRYLGESMLEWWLWCLTIRDLSEYFVVGIPWGNYPEFRRLPFLKWWYCECLLISCVDVERGLSQLFHANLHRFLPNLQDTCLLVEVSSSMENKGDFIELHFSIFFYLCLSSFVSKVVTFLSHLVGF